MERYTFETVLTVPAAAEGSSLVIERSTETRYHPHSVLLIHIVVNGEILSRWYTFLDAEKERLQVIFDPDDAATAALHFPNGSMRFRSDHANAVADALHIERPALADLE